MTTELTAVSLFDGIGGFPEALRRAGIRTVATVEIDKAAAGVAGDHFPDARQFHDVTEVSADQILDAGFVPERGILTAGWPCQDVSVAGRRRGLDEGDRSGLAWEVVRLAAELHPKWLILENVPGLLSDKGDFVDPRCICGWTGGWRGVRLRDERRAEGAGAEVLLDRSGDRDVRQGTRLAPDDGAGIWRNDQALPTSDGTVVRGSRVDSGRRTSGVVPPAIATTPDPQARSGAAGAESDGGSQDPDTCGRGECAVDDRGRGPLRGGESLGSGDEPEGPGSDHRASPDSGPVRCPACGRSVGDEPRRPVLRHGMGTVLGALAQLGFWWSWRILDAQHFGVPQRRRRVVIVANLGDRAAPTQVLLEPEGGTGHSRAGRPAWANPVSRPGALVDGSRRPVGQGVVNALTSNMGGGDGGVDDNTAQGGHLIAGALTRRHGKGPGSDLPNGHDVAVREARVSPVGGQGVRDLTADGADASEDGTGRGTPLVPIAFDWQSDGERTQGNMSTERTSTLGTTNRDAVMESMAVRRLTPVECERLQGYPDGWTATSNGRPQADAPRYRQLGNSIAVPVFAWVAARIVAHENTCDT